MEAGGTIPAGSGRSARLDPFALPVRFPAKDAGADGQMRQVELHRDAVVVRRAVRGMRMKIRLPLQVYTGLTLQLAQDGASLLLDHSDSLLSIPLLEHAAPDEAISIGRAWSRVLGLALRECDADGGLRELQPARTVRIGEDAGRQRRRGAIKRRRPSILLRRKRGRHIAFSVVYRGEREIIARN